ncbi:hypothetical protein R0K20_14385, partial [Staphylococcus sp. SIMBA_130]
MKGNSIEIRLPWALFNVKDPSEKEIMGDMWKDGLSASKKIDGFKVGLVMYEGDEEDASLSLASINETRPVTKNGQLD